MKIIAAVNNYCTVRCMHYAFHQMGQEKIRGFAGVQRKDFFKEFSWSWKEIGSVQGRDSRSGTSPQ